MLVNMFNTSERRACRVIGRARSALRKPLKAAHRDAGLATVLAQKAGENPRFGYRRICALLRKEGAWRGLNRKRVYRLWVALGLSVAQKPPRPKRSAEAADQHLLRAERPNHVWTYDFIHDRTVDGRAIRILSIVDEFTRECLGLHVARSFKAADVVRVIEGLTAVRGCPVAIRSDNGPEFAAKAIREWLAAAGTKTIYIEPGSPWENPFIESFHSRLRDELLKREDFHSVREARVVLQDHRNYYNNARPHSSLGYAAPAEFAASWASGEGAGAGSSLRTAAPQPSSATVQRRELPV